ncbi:DUF1440 domain-containing protein [Acidisarcina polymorpha]|nr:DUF1440 domain-containing protein [Acidisarcina polymorpha]
MTGPGKKLQEALQSEAENQKQEAASGEPKEDATMKTADVITQTTTGGQHLSWEGKQKGGPIVHYAFGAIMGGLYGGLAEYSSFARSGFGASFGSTLFGVADLFAVPALHLSPPATDQPPSSLTSPFAAHIIYGVTTELGRRIVRAVL